MLKKVLAMILVVGFVVGALLLFALFGGEEPKRPGRKPRPAAKPVYSDFATFSGRTPGKTRTFHIDRGPWRLNWEIKGLPYSANAAFTVFSENAALAPVLDESDLAPPAKGSIKIEETGAFYIIVSSFDADWRLTVQRLEPPVEAARH